MDFFVPESDTRFGIADDWWHFCDMETWSPRSPYFPYDPEITGSVTIVALSEIEPPKRAKGVPMFRKYKLVPVLLAFQSPECALPPVELLQLDDRGPKRYALQNGFHRFYASVAAGYSKIPAVIFAKGIE